MTEKGEGESGRDGTEATRINLGGMGADTPVYRTIPLRRLYELFGNRENVLPRPSKWDDPFENFILKSPVQISSGEIGRFGFHDHVYGQCWTLHKASDATWRIYSPDKNAVRIRSTIGTLAASLSATLGEWAHTQVFIGKVDYLFEPELRQFAATVFEDGLSAEAIARSLLVKRRAFKHEREIRLIYCERETVNHADDLYRYPVDPNTLVTQIMVDPRLPKAEADRLKGEIRNRTGFGGDIKRSLLYAPPKGFLIMMP